MIEKGSKQREKETDRVTQRETKRESDRQTEIEINRDTERERNKEQETERQEQCWSKKRLLYIQEVLTQCNLPYEMGKDFLYNR